MAGTAQRWKETTCNDLAGRSCWRRRLYTDAAAGVLQDGQSAVCTSQAPFSEWECGRRIEQRIDGPTWIVRQEGDQLRNFVFARKHLPCTFKRTAIYELRGDITDPSADIEVCEIQETKEAVGGPWSAMDVAFEDDGSFTADFGPEVLPAAAYPVVR